MSRKMNTILVIGTTLEVLLLSSAQNHFTFSDFMSIHILAHIIFSQTGKNEERK